MKTGGNMKHLHVIFFIAFLAITNSVYSDQTEFDDCILEHLRGAKLDVATHVIKQACNENYKNSNITSDKKRAYNNCLLEHLVGVENLQAVMDIKAACSSKHK